MKAGSRMKHPHIFFCLLIATVLPGYAAVKHRFIVLDEGAQQVLLIDQNHVPNLIWKTSTPGNNRDLQLIGGNRVMVSCQAGGYWEIDIATGKILKEALTAFGATQSARRLPSGNTILAGDNLNGHSGITFVEIDSNKTIKRTFAVANTQDCRVVRRTRKSTFLFGTADHVYEADSLGKIIWQQPLQIVGGWYGGYMALRLRNGNTLVGCGYQPELREFSPAGQVLRTIGGFSQPDSAAILPHFYAGFEVLQSGHIVTTNWEGHGTGNGAIGIQALEYDAQGNVVWSWKDTSSTPCYSSLQHIILLDSIDTKQMYDDVNGFLYPVFGCMNKNSPNYDSLAIADDGSCNPVVAILPGNTVPVSSCSVARYIGNRLFVTLPDADRYSIMIHSLDGRQLFAGYYQGRSTVIVPDMATKGKMTLLTIANSHGYRAVHRLVMY
jgi:hypothetical protein